MARKGEEIEPYTLRIADHDDDERWLQLLVIPFQNEEQRTLLAHCAFRIDRTHVIESYLDRVAARTPVNAKRDFDLEESRAYYRHRSQRALSQAGAISEPERRREALDANLGYQYSGARLGLNLRYRVFMLSEENALEQTQFTTLHGPEVGLVYQF